MNADWTFFQWVGLHGVIFWSIMGGLKMADAAASQFSHWSPRQQFVSQLIGGPFVWLWLVFFYLILRPGLRIARTARGIFERFVWEPLA